MNLQVNRPRCAAAALLVIFVLSAPQVAAADAVPPSSSNWTQLLPINLPPTRAAAAMAYDPDSGTLVLFGGFRDVGDQVVYLNDTWLFDGNTWTDVTRNAAPPVRAAAGMAFDAVTHEIVLFGGYNGSRWLGDTWTFDSGHMRWRSERPKRSPRAVTGPAVFQDPLTGHVCEFGGFDGQFYQSFTWRWDGRTWTRVITATSPYARSAPAYALDPVLHEVVMFGGLGDVNPNNTWTFDGTDWTLQNPTSQPPLRFYSGAAYEPSADGVIFFGAGLADTWFWTGSDWVQLFPAASPPSGRESFSMALDEALGHVIVFGGDDASGEYNDTWEFTAVP